MPIEIKESIQDKSSLFNIKRIRYRNFKSDSSMKTFDANKINQQTFKFLLNNVHHSDIVLETTKEINNLDRIKKLLDEDIAWKIFSYFGKKKFFGTIHHNILFTFNVTRDDAMAVSRMTEFFDLYHAHSNFWLFVPNFKVRKTLKTGKNKTKKVKILNPEMYLKLVENIREVLEYRNDKPIFVPLSLKFGITEIRTLMEEYLKREYFYIWIDFEGSPINEKSLGILRNLFRMIDNKECANDIILYFTNIRREIISHVNDPKTPASDILSTLSGSNIVGVNKEPKRYVDVPKFNKEQLRSHKARIFSSRSYYYIKALGNLMDQELDMTWIDPSLTLKNIEYNVTTNSILLQNEIKKQCQLFLNNNEIQRYIKSKEMLKKFKEGALLDRLFFSRTSTTLKTLKEWF